MKAVPCKTTGCEGLSIDRAVGVEAPKRPLTLWVAILFQIHTFKHQPLTDVHLHLNEETSMKTYLSCVAGLLVTASYTLTSLSAHAQDYPVKPITIVVGYSAGGGVDQMAMGAE